MKNIIVILSTILIFILSSCDSHKEEKVEEEDTYTITNPIKLDTFINREYVCQIRSIQHIEIRALEKGYLQEIYVDEGQTLKKGQLMFQIMPLLYQAEMQKAQAELETGEAEAKFAKIEYQNTKVLADSNIVSKNELALAKAKLDQAIAKVDQAKAKLALAQVHLNFTEIRAPFDGIMDRFQVRLGSLVAEGDLLTVLSDNSKVWVYFNVPEAEYLDYKMNAKTNQMMKVQLRMANNQMFEYPGIVETIEADFNNETGNIAFRATFPNPEKLLRHGETGTIVVETPMKDAILIPQKATYEVLDKKYVYVLDKDNVLKSRKITVEAELPDLYVVRDGLDEHDKILLEGLRKVRENEKIHCEFEEPKAVLAQLKLHAE